VVGGFRFNSMRSLHLFVYGRPRKPYDKLKSISTGALLDRDGDADWLLSSNRVERGVLLGVPTPREDYQFTVGGAIRRYNFSLPVLTFTQSLQYRPC